MIPSEILPFLVHAIKYKKNVLLTGRPGIGKTDVVKQAALIANTQLHITHPVIHGPEDYSGYPMTVNGVPQMVPFKDLRILIDAIVPTTYFLDDMGQAAQATQKSLMQVLWEKRIGSHDISSYISFVAATNRRGDKAGVTSILEAVKSRMTIIPFDFDIKSWITWAVQHNIPPLLIAFHRFRPDMLGDDNFKPTSDIINSPSPRTVAEVGDWINTGAIDVNRISHISSEAHQKSDQKSKENALKGSEFEIITGCCGEGYAIEFLSYVRVYRDLPDVNMILKNPDKVDVPNQNRPDVLYALVSTLVSRAEESNIDNIFKYIERISVEFGTLFVNDMSDKDNELCDSKGFLKWCEKHNDIIVDKD